MSEVLTTIINTGVSGYLINSMGILSGFLLSFYVNKRGKRFRGTVLGFIGGLMLSIVSFDLLPESFAEGSIYIAAIGISFGLVFALLLDDKLNHKKISIIHKYHSKYLKIAVYMALGIGIHNIPCGIALGSLSSLSPEKVPHLTMALILHGIPEGLAIGIFLKESKANLFSFILISIVTSIPMGAGAVLGSLIRNVSPSIICLGLAFAGGMILYSIYSETLPSATDTWNGRLSTIGNVLGMIIGILILSLFR